MGNKFLLFRKNEYFCKFLRVNIQLILSNEST